MEALRGAIEQRFNGDAFQRVIYTESDGEVAERSGNARVPELIWRGNADSYYSQKRSTLGAALVFTAPGIPMIFMGQEFLEWGAWTDAEQLDWSKAECFAGIRTLYRDLIRQRRKRWRGERRHPGSWSPGWRQAPKHGAASLHFWERSSRMALPSQGATAS